MSEWPVRTLGEVFELRYGKNLPTGSRQAGAVPVYGSNGVVGRHNEAFTSGPTIVIGRKGSIGSIHLSREPCWPIDTTYFVDTFDGHDPSFWAHQLRTLNLSALNRSTAIPGISREDAYALQVVVPPFDVQRRIVAKLDELLAQSRAAREQLDAVPALVEQYRRSVLAAAFRGDLTADWRKKNPDVEPASKLLERIRIERRQKWEAAELAKLKAKGKSPKDDKWKSKYVEPKPVDTSDLPELPPTWSWASLEEITAEADGIVDGPFGSNLKSADYAAEGPVVVRLGNLGVGVFKDGDLSRVPHAKFEQLRRHEVIQGDLVVSALAEPVGRCCEVPPSLGKAIVKADCVRVRPVAELSRQFVMWSLNTPGSLARAANSGHGLGRVRMNLTDIRARPVPVAPTAEQPVLNQALMSAMDGPSGARMVAFDLMQNVESFERALLAKAFRGELVS